MGIKMATARDAAGNEWQADEYIKGKGQEPLRCKHCPTQITYQSAHTRQLHEKSILVPGYFRLLQHGQHAENCRFAIDRNIEHLVKPSDGLIESLRNGKYRLRLMMVAEAFAAARKTSSTRLEGKRAGTATSYVRQSNRLPAYINSAKKVLLLRAACEEDAQIENYLELVFDGDTVVPWSQFYFQTERFMEAFRSLENQTTKHPMALHGVVNTKRSPIINGKSRNVLNLHRPRYVEDDKDSKHGIGVEASVWCDNADWFDGIAEGAEILVLGMWKAKRASRHTVGDPDKHRFSDFTTHKLSLTPVILAQIARVPVSSS